MSKTSYVSKEDSRKLAMNAISHWLLNLPRTANVSLTLGDLENLAEGLGQLIHDAQANAES